MNLIGRNEETKKRMRCLFSLLVIGTSWFTCVGVSTAQLSLENFESYEVGTSIADEAGWSVRFGEAKIAEAPKGSGVSKVLRLVGGSAPAVEVERQVAGDESDSVTFIDFMIKPVVELVSEPMTSIHVNGSVIAFLREEGAGGLGAIYVLDGDDDTVGSGWVELPYKFKLDTDSRTALDWMRLTVRHDYTAGVWDLFVEGKLFAADLGFDGRESVLHEWLMFGSSCSADVLIDDMQAVTQNPLFVDVDSDGIADAHEIAWGWDTSSNDRNLLDIVNWKTRIASYIETIHSNYSDDELDPMLVDTDADGMPDFWENLYGLNPLDPSDADIDIDRDDATNLAEYVRGTTPKSPPLYEMFEFDFPDTIGGAVVRYVSSNGMVVAGTCTTATGQNMPFVFQGGTFQLITLPEGARYGYPTAVSNSGKVSGYFQDENWKSKGFVWNGSSTTLVHGEQNYSYVYAVNDTGDYCGSFVDMANVRYGFRNQETGAISGLSNFLPTLNFLSDGGLIGGSGRIFGKTLAFVLRPGNVVEQLVPAAYAPSYSYIRNMNPDGTCAGYFYGGGQTRAFRWRPATNGGAGTTELLGSFSGSTYSLPYGMGLDGAAVGVSRDSSNRNVAALWPADGLSPLNLGTLGGQYSTALAVTNNNGEYEVVGTSSDINGAYHPYIWKFGKMTALKDCVRKDGSWSMTSVHSVNDEGYIVVSGYKNSRQTFAVLSPQIDGDGDGVPDVMETAGMNPLDRADGDLDADGDGLSARIEYLQGSNPGLRDSDLDQMPDDWEFAYNLNPTDSADADMDYDGDKLTNRQEYFAGTNPLANFQLESSTGIEGDYVYVSGANNSGTVVGQTQNYSDGYSVELWEWSELAGRLDLSIGSGMISGWLYGVTMDGHVVGEVYDADYNQFIAIWAPGASVPSLFQAPGADYAYVTSVSDGGRVAMSCSSYANNSYSAWSCSFDVSDPYNTLQTHHALPGWEYCYLYGVDSAGSSLFLWYDSDWQSHSGVLAPNEPLSNITEILPSGLTSVYAYQMNNAGQVLGYGYALGSPLSFLWKNGEFTDVTPTAYGGGYYYDVDLNDLGDVLASSSAGGLLTRHGYSVPISKLATISQEWALGSPHSIDNNGIVVGEGSYNGRGTFYRLAMKDDENANGIPDDWETYHFLGTVYSSYFFAGSDYDGDGLSNADEFYYGTDPNLADSDHDGVFDRQEILWGRDPNLSDLGVPSTLLINEFVAKASTSYRDYQNRDFDWIEIHNPTNADIQLAGWKLQDTSEIWNFPNRTLPAFGFVVVFMSDLNQIISTPRGEEWHTNFKLKNEGENLRLINPSGVVVQEFAPKTPNLDTDISYALVDNYSRWRFCDKPTPGAPNPDSDSLHGIPHYFDRDSLINEQPSHVSSYYEEPFELTFGGNQFVGKVLRYTLDGSDPTPLNATTRIYHTGDPIRIETTTTVRYKVDGDGIKSAEGILTYIFPEDVVKQQRPIDVPVVVPRTRVIGEPVPLLTSMNPSAVSFYGKDSVKQQLVDGAPVMSLTCDDEGLFGGAGVFSTSGDHVAQPVGVDFFAPVSQGGMRFSAKASVKRKFESKNEDSLKLNLVLDFSRNSGGKLGVALFDQPAQENQINIASFTKLNLRAARFDSFSYVGETEGDASSYRARATYIKDWWVAKTQREMLAVFAAENPGLNLPPVPRRRLVHLYLNGMYWGVYELMEEMDSQFLKDHYNNSSLEAEDFAGVSRVPGAYRNDPLIRSRYADAELWWQTNQYAKMKSFGITLPADLEAFGQGNYNALTDIVSIEAFFDYTLLNLFINNDDWPLRPDTFVSHAYTTAYVANGSHVGAIDDLSPEADLNYTIPLPGNIYQKGVFIATNADRSFAPWSSSDPSPWDALLGPEAYRKPEWHSYGNPAEFGYYMRSLAYFPENRTLLRQRIDHLFGDGGVLSQEAGRERLQRLYNEMSQVIRAESARWGHSAAPGGNGPNFYTDKDWQNAVFWMRDSFFGGSTGVSEIPPQTAGRGFDKAELPHRDPATGGIADEGEEGWLSPLGGGGSGGGSRQGKIEKNSPADPGVGPGGPDEPDGPKEPSAPEEFERDDDVSVIAYLPGTKSAPGGEVTPPGDKSKKYVSLILANDDNDDEDPVPPEEGEEWPHDSDEETDEDAAITENDDDIVKVDLNIAGALSNLTSSVGGTTSNASTQSGSASVTTGAITSGNSSSWTLVTLTIPEGVRPFDETGKFLKKEDRSFFVETVNSSNPLSGLASGQTVSIFLEGLQGSYGGSVILRVTELSENEEGGGSDGGNCYQTSESSASNMSMVFTSGAGPIIPVQTGQQTQPQRTTKTNGVIMVPIDLTEVISDQIAGNEANKLPTLYYGAQPNNPMLMATRSGNDAYIIVNLGKSTTTVVPVFIGVRQCATSAQIPSSRPNPILNSIVASIVPGRNPINFPAMSGSKAYEVVAGFDSDSSGGLDPNEAVVIFEKTPKINPDGTTYSPPPGKGDPTFKWIDKFTVVTEDDFISARNTTDGYGGLPFSFLYPTAANLISGFARGATTIIGSSPAKFNIVLDASVIPSAEGLSHPLGGVWDAMNKTKTHRVVLPDGSDLSDDVEASTGLKDMYGVLLWDNHIQLGAGAPSGWGAIILPVTYENIDFATSDSKDQVHAALGKCKFVGHLHVSLKAKSGGGFDVGALRCYGSIVDLYDFAYGADKVFTVDPKNAARTQAGNATLTSTTHPDAGRVFYTEVEIDTGWEPYIGTYP